MRTRAGGVKRGLRLCQKPIDEWAEMWCRYQKNCDFETSLKNDFQNLWSFYRFFHDFSSEFHKICIILSSYYNFNTPDTPVFCSASPPLAGVLLGVLPNATIYFNISPTPPKSPKPIHEYRGGAKMPNNLRFLSIIFFLSSQICAIIEVDIDCLSKGNAPS